MPPVNEALKGVHLISLNAKAIHLIEDMVIRIRIVDQVGDEHERTFSGFISPQHRRQVTEYFKRTATTPTGTRKPSRHLERALRFIRR